MKKKRLTIFLISLGLLWFNSCQKDINSEKAIKIAVDINKNNELKYSNIIKTIRFVPLETTDSNLMTNPHFLRINEEKIYILDDIRSNSFFVFDKKGNYKFKIHNPGKGPKESLSSDYFQIYNSKIYIYDMNCRNLNIYDMQGNFLRKCHINQRFYQFYFKSNDSLIASVNNLEHTSAPTGYNLLFMTKDGEIHGKRFPINEKKDYAFLNPLNFIRYNDSFTWLPVLNRTIYKLKDKNNIKAKYILDFGKYWAPDKFFNKHKRLRDFKNSNYVFFVRYFETSEHLFFNFQLDNSWRQAIYCKSTGHVKVAYNSVDDICSGLSYNKRIKGKYRNKLIFLLYPEDIKTFLKNYDKKNIKKHSFQFKNYIKLREIDANTERGDNPILVFITLKKF